jgi:hypothetical protein
VLTAFGLSRLGKADGDGLLRRTRAVFAFADVMEFFPDKFSRLCRRSLPFARIFARSFNSFLFWHN